MGSLDSTAERSDIVSSCTSEFDNNRDFSETGAILLCVAMEELTLAMDSTEQKCVAATSTSNDPSSSTSSISTPTTTVQTGVVDPSASSSSSEPSETEKLELQTAEQCVKDVNEVSKKATTEAGVTGDENN